MPVLRSFPPAVAPGCRLLILGSMPGEASLRAGQYYAHPRNAFWPIMGALCGADPAQPYPLRLTTLQAAGIALWDVLHSCTRAGSLDTAIRDEVANDFPAFFVAYPAITHIFFNGAKAETAFRRHALPALLGNTRTLRRLPSTSPAHASLALPAKCRAWSVIREV
jgi:hypoxanthine-DNA glycosylase